MHETWVPSLGWEDPMEKEMATHASILSSEISLTEEPGRLESIGSQRIRHDWVSTHTHITESESGQGRSLHAVEKQTKRKVAFTAFKGKKTQHSSRPWLPPYHPQAFEFLHWYQKIAGSYIKSERTVRLYRKYFPQYFGRKFLTQNDLSSNMVRKLVCQSWLAPPPRSWWLKF